MNTKLALLWTVSLLLGCSGAWADQHDSTDEAESTIRIMDASDGTLPDAVTREIELPALPEDTAAVDAAAGGFEAAEAGIARREGGLATAEGALENRQDMANDALENVENRGRYEDFIPDGIPETPDVPEVPQPPSGG